MISMVEALATLAIMVSWVPIPRIYDPIPKPRPKPRPAVYQHATASWYNDAGTTASGIHYRYGYASLIFGSAWGTKVEFCYRACIIGQLDDHGPYVSGRTFDLNAALKAATGCPDICYLKWRHVK